MEATSGRKRTVRAADVGVVAFARRERIPQSPGLANPPGRRSLLVDLELAMPDGPPGGLEGPDHAEQDDRAVVIQVELESGGDPGLFHESAGREPVFWDDAQRAWERLCANRRSRAQFGRFTSLAGFLRDLFDLPGWVDAARVVVYGVLGVIWSQVWGGESRGGGWMVNAACMYRDSGRLRNPPQVVEL